ncbi:MAG: hypothetical protein IPF38_11095 [Burkholderiales bacterium]|nr:hypothetical protein [Burkholderiales bacterium]
MTQNWVKVVQSLRSLDMGAMGAGMPGAGAKQPEIRFLSHKVARPAAAVPRKMPWGWFSQGMTAVIPRRQAFCR